MNVLEKILQEIKELKRKQNNQNQDYRTGYFSALSTVEGVIAGLNDGWIPVEERLLPNKNGVYNVTRLIDDAFISDSAYFDGQDTWHNDNRVNHARPYLTDIVAWQPLPEAYHPKQAPAAEHIMSRFTRVD